MKKFIPKKITAIAAAMALMAGAMPNFTAFADYYTIDLPIQCADFGKYYSEWQEIEELIDLKEGHIVVSRDGLRTFLVSDDGTCDHFLLRPGSYYVTKEQSEEITAFLTENYPDVKLWGTEEMIDTEETGIYRFSIDFLSSPTLEIQVAKDIKAATGVSCDYVVGKENFPVKKHLGSLENFPDGLEKLRELSFEELLDMSKAEICAVSPEARKMFLDIEYAITAGSGYSHDPTVIFRSIADFADTEAPHSLSRPSIENSDLAELARQVYIPEKYIERVGSGDKAMLGDTGEYFYDVMIYLDPAADTEHNNIYTQIRLIMSMKLCENKNIVKVWNAPTNSGSANGGVDARFKGEKFEPDLPDEYTDNVTYLPTFPNDNFDYMGKRFKEWSAMTKYNGFKDSFAAVSERDGLLRIEPQEDGTYTCRSFGLLPDCYYVTAEELAKIEEFVKENYPLAKVEKRYDEEADMYLVMVVLRRYPEKEFAFAEDIKANLGIMCDYIEDDEAYPVEKVTGDIDSDDSLEELRYLPFEEFLELTKDDICGVSPEAEKLYKMAETILNDPYTCEQPDVVFRSVEGFKVYDEYRSDSDPAIDINDELSRQIGVPKEYIFSAYTQCLCYASSYGRAYYDVAVQLNPNADTAHTNKYTQTRLLMRILMAEQANDNIYMLDFDKLAGGASGNGSPAPDPVTLYGDANLDGAVTIADATAILQHCGNNDKYGLTGTAYANADCCDPGSGVSAMDALAIQQFDAKIVKSLPLIS